MTVSLKTLAFAAAVALPAGSALAGSIDFTDELTYSFSATQIDGSVDGVSYKMTPTPSEGPLTRAKPGPLGIATLVGDNDGIGIVDDEVTAANELLLLTFTNTVSLTGLYFLDLFKSASVTSQASEHVFVSVDGGAAIQFGATEAFSNTGFGYGEFLGQSLTGQKFLFTAGGNNPGNNDSVGNPDFALARLDVAPVPLPAGVLLLGGALGGLGFMRRRAAKKAA